MAILRPDIDLGHTTVVVSWIFAAITLILICTVTYAKCSTTKRFGIDDGLMIGSALILIGQVGHITWAIRFENANKHVNEMSHSDSILLSKSLAVNEAIWGIANTFIRVSALVGLRQIFGPVRMIRYLFWIILPVLVAFGLINVLQVPLMCRPIQAMWDSTVDGHCVNETVVYLTFEAIGLVLDLVLLFSPLAPIYRLQIEKKLKVLFWTLFTVPGLLCLIVTGFRMEAFKLVSSSDFTYTKGYIGLLSTLGVALGLIATSVTYGKLLGNWLAASWDSCKSKWDLRYRWTATWDSVRSPFTETKSSHQVDQQQTHEVDQEHECFKHMSSDQEKLAHKIDLENLYCTHINKLIKERSWEEHGENCFYKACKSDATRDFQDSS